MKTLSKSDLETDFLAPSTTCGMATEVSAGLTFTNLPYQPTARSSLRHHTEVHPSGRND